MGVIQRPAKEGNATTYQGKVAQGFTKILASEVDADLDRIYAAWNGGADTVNIGKDAITSDKIAPGAVGSRELQDGGVKTIDLGDLQVTTIKLADANVTGAKIANAPNGVGTNNLNDGAVTLAKLGTSAKTLGGDLSGTIDAAVVLKSTGNFDAGGQMTFKGTAPGTITGALNCNTPGVMYLDVNRPSVPQDPAKASWSFELDASADQMRLMHRAPGAAGGTMVQQLGVSGVGDLFLAGGLVVAKGLGVTGQITGKFMGGVKWDASATAFPYAAGWAEVHFPDTVAGGSELAPAGNNYLRSPTLPGNPRCYCAVSFNAMTDQNFGGGIAFQIERFDGTSWLPIAPVYANGTDGGVRFSVSAVWCFDAGTNVRVNFGNLTTGFLRLSGMYPTFSMVYLGTV